jgi:hypothetical protein
MASNIIMTTSKIDFQFFNLLMEFLTPLPDGVAPFANAGDVFIIPEFSGFDILRL